jgi:alpha-ketoglutarate-dependent taurine dioxygenase
MHLADPRAWSAAAADSPASWRPTLSSSLLASLHETILDMRSRPRPILTLQSHQEPCAADAAELRAALTILERGHGFVVLGVLPLERYSVEEATAAYWLLGQLLGEPIVQNVQGTLLYDVCDTGQDVRYGARFSVTNAESSFHTDNSFGEQIADYVGLLCLKTARAGGLSQIVSGHAVHERLRREAPDVLRILAQPFHVDRRGGAHPGESSTVRYPVMSGEGDGLVCRYLRYWIEAGHEKAGEPLTTDQRRALDTLDVVLGDPKLRIEFDLHPGEMLFVNNRWIFHNRTAFDDHAEPERKRHLVRLWLRRRSD